MRLEMKKPPQQYKNMLTSLCMSEEEVPSLGAAVLLQHGPSLPHKV